MQYVANLWGLVNLLKFGALWGKHGEGPTHVVHKL